MRWGPSSNRDGNATTPTRQPPDSGVRTLNDWRKGIHGPNNNKDFETFAAQSMVRILKMTTRLLDNTEKKAKEWTEKKTLQQMTGSIM